MKYRRTSSTSLVDEYQDTSRSQHLLVTTLANREGEEFPSIFVVGDSDQAIYGFRDADVRNINLFRVEAYPNGKEIQLQNNYRSSGYIVSAAQALIVHNSNRINRDSKAVQGQGRETGVAGSRHPRAGSRGNRGRDPEQDGRRHSEPGRVLRALPDQPAVAGAGGGTPSGTSAVPGHGQHGLLQTGGNTPATWTTSNWRSTRETGRR